MARRHRSLRPDPQGGASRGRRARVLTPEAGSPSPAAAPAVAFAGSLGGTVASAWALMGVSILFASAVYRLGARGIATVRDGLGPWEWTALVLLTVTFVYGEGFRVLDRRWVPDMLKRALRLRRDGGVLLRLLAPLYGLSLIGAPRHRLLRAWAGTAAIVLAVLLVRSFPEPWRGITDFAVAAALAWGLLAILRRVLSALR